MPQFIKDNTYRTPFGKNQYLRSTQDVKFESYRVAASTVPSVTVDGTATKVLQPGTVMAKITSGGATGQVGPYDDGATDGRQTIANIVGLNDTFLPWQLNEYADVEVAVAYECTAVASWCLESDGSALIAMQGATKNSIETTQVDGLKLNFK